MEDNPQSQRQEFTKTQQEPTQTQQTQTQTQDTTTQTPTTASVSSNTLKVLPPSRPTILSQSNSIGEAILKPWHNLLRPSLLGPNTPSTSSQLQLQSQLSQSISDHSTFTFCQNRIISSTQDLTKLIQNSYSAFSQDTQKLETLIFSTKDIIQTIQDENTTQNEKNATTSTLTPDSLLLRESG